MPKERNFNPVQAHRKAEKAKTIRKGKAEIQSRRNEKLARQNPDRIQKQIDDLKAIADKGGKLSAHEQRSLETLEKELSSVKKAREVLGDKAPTFSRSGPRHDGRERGNVLGKRRRDGGDGTSSDSDVAEDVKKIPMPRDTPPPIPKEVLDQWYAKRRARRNADQENAGRENASNANQEPLGHKSRVPRQQQPVPAAKTVYEAKPIVRDLKKEAVSAFMPTTVRMKKEKGQGTGGLLEPEEADRLEKEGYLNTSQGPGKPMRSTHDTTSAEEQGGPRGVTVEEVDDEQQG